MDTIYARTVELTPTTILIDGEALPWPLSPDWAISYRAHTVNKQIWLLSFAVLAESVSGVPDQPMLDGHPVPWALASPGMTVSRFKSQAHAVSMTVLIDTSIREKRQHDD